VTASSLPTRLARRVRLSAALLLGIGVLAALPAYSASAAPVASASSARTALQYVVPAGVTRLTVSLAGAIGRDTFCDTHTAGWGGSVTATIPVTVGEVLQLNVASTNGVSASGNASDIRRSPYGPADRLVVAGGGGSNSDFGGKDEFDNCKTTRTGRGLGGDGGAPAGRSGTGEVAGSCAFPGGHGGGGGTLSAPGTGGTTCGPGGAGADGSFGFGGTGGTSGVAGVAPCDRGGAGGDGWYGGGGGGGTLGAIGSPGGCTDAGGQSVVKILGGGGGGGSSYAVPAATGVVYSPGVNGDIIGWVTAAPALRPSVRTVSPGHGPKAGGQKVTVTGRHFTSVVSVTFGAKPGKHVVVVSATRLTVRSPAHATGVVHVRVRTSGGTSAKVRADHYRYR
jgi:hypothetical protein